MFSYRNNTVVKKNLLSMPFSLPQCGKNCGASNFVFFNGAQLECNRCGWESDFDDDFIEQYKKVVSPSGKLPH